MRYIIDVITSVIVIIFFLEIYYITYFVISHNVTFLIKIYEVLYFKIYYRLCILQNIFYKCVVIKIIKILVDRCGLKVSA